MATILDTSNYNFVNAALSFYNFLNNKTYIHEFKLSHEKCIIILEESDEYILDMIDEWYDYRIEFNHQWSMVEIILRNNVTIVSNISNN